MDDVVPALGTVPLLLIAVAAVALLLLLIIVLRLHAFVALVLVSALTALATRIPVNEVVDTLLDGFGSTLASVALLVGLGAMIGKLLEVTGGAGVLAETLINRFGEKRAPLALGIASLLFGFPIFFDAGFVVFLPIILSVAKRFGGSVLLYALPSAGAFATMHAFVPPHPGPVGAAGILEANTGLVLIMGLLIGVPTWFVASYLFGLWAGRRIHLPVPDAFGAEEDRDEETDRPAGGTGGSVTRTTTATPKFSTVLVLLLLPLVLILLNTGLNTLAVEGIVDGDAGTVAALRLLGQTSIALLITTIVAMVVLGRERFSRSEVESIVNSSLGPVCAIILVTGAGGMFGGVLRASGIGTALADSLSAIGLPVIVAAFIIALCLRIAQGSATVALTTTAGLIAPVVAQSGLSSLDLALVVIAIASGSTALSHVNDSGFWLVGRFLGMDEKTTLKTWTVMVTLIGVIGFALSFVVSLVV
ncbi:GntP family permease [Pseudonocardia kunmingensis]|uniref:GntP family gluconate:H+ symporter n=1 Tax=Pseudonocardia kunmingensis TaxID=630975 RepID=A0A543DKH5_9PSEU|nr:GntP family permease [Pseudonocardia kunmingensis]TQM09755.1 GntP family gluconate:H+ symporter [Pseudonocardia kunmingensis]